MPETTPTLHHATDFVLSHATDDDLTRLIAAIKQRRTTLVALRIASLVTGTPVSIANITPKYLNGLTGRIVGIDGKHATIELDATSTDRLRHTSQTRFHVPENEDSTDVEGIPLACCIPT